MRWGVGSGVGVREGVVGAGGREDFADFADFAMLRYDNLKSSGDRLATIGVLDQITLVSRHIDLGYSRVEKYAVTSHSTQSSDVQL